MTNDEKLEVIEDVASEIGGEVRYDYSGRGMYGKTCVGIVGDDATEIIEETSARGLRGSRTDGMGRQVIVYWETVTSEMRD